MDYQFENLDPERFQQFCQALLVNEFPNVQCFPVAQPDGGRDAIIYFQSGKTFHKTIVFQIKFVRKPQLESNPHQWLINILEKEVPKVRTLIKEGTAEYYLLTNVSGTAHFEAGSIDRVNKILRDALEIPAYCWWRDDLSRRLDNAWSLKWAYPDLMTGPDMLRQIIEAGLPEEQARRTSALRSRQEITLSVWMTKQPSGWRFPHSYLISLFLDESLELSLGRNMIPTTRFVSNK